MCRFRRSPGRTTFPSISKLSMGDRITIPGGAQHQAAARPASTQLASAAPAYPAPAKPVQPPRIAAPAVSNVQTVPVETARVAKEQSVAAPESPGEAGRSDRRHAVVPLAGEGPRHRRLRQQAERQAERRHQSRGAGRHAGQGGRRRRRRLCRQRAQGLRQSRAGAPLERLRVRLCARQRAAW